MTDVISLHIGGCGAKIGIQMWQKLIAEQKIDSDNPIGKLGFFRPNSDGTYTNRAIFIDTDPRLTNLLNTSTINIPKQNILTRNQSCHNLFPQGKYHQGPQIQDEIVERMRKQIQLCDSFSGFILTSGVGGGNGSGICSLILSKLREEYPQYMVQCFPVIPDINNNFNALEVYNAVMWNHYVIEFADVIYPIENKQIHSTLMKMNNLHSTYDDVNAYIADGLVEHTAPYRFSGSMNTNQRKMATNFLLFPRIKFISSIFSKQYEPDHMGSALTFKHKFLSVPERDEPRIFTMSAHVRGDPFAYQSDVHMKIHTEYKKLNKKFVQWVPNNIHMSFIDQCNRTKMPSTLLHMNGQSCVNWLKIAAEEFTKTFRRKGYLYHYTSLGMDQMQFTEAQSNSNDLISQYIPWGTTSFMEEEFDEDGSQG